MNTIDDDRPAWRVSETPITLDSDNVARRRALVRQSAGLPEIGAGLTDPGPLDLFILSHQSVQDLVARSFPGFSSLVHVAQDIEIVDELQTGDGYSCTPRFSSARPTGSDADLVVACTVALHGKPVGRLRAQIRLGGVSAEAVQAVLVEEDDAPSQRPTPVRDGLRRSAELSFDAAAVAAYADLSGDHNPIHLDDQAGRTAGFDGAIVHGMAVVAAACESALAGFAQDEIRAVSRMSARFSAATPVGSVSRCELMGAADGSAVTFKVAGPNGTSVKNGYLGLAVRP